MTVATGGAGPRDGNELFLALLAAVAASLGVLWLSVQLSTLLWFRTSASAGLAAVVDAVPDLVRDPTDTAAAFAADAGPIAPAVVLWPTVVALFVATTWILVRLASRAGGRVGVSRRHRLGVAEGAHLASRRELGPLVISQPEAGRLTLGRVRRRLVATENRTTQTSTQRRDTRRGDRSAVAVIGPTRCGKTANTISGILEWDGPAVLSSVKSDLLDATIARRSELGEVAVFDPAGLTGWTSCGWSPLRGVDSAVDAMKRSQQLVDALPSDGAANMDFFKAMADQLLWPMLFAAAVGDSSIADVARWVTTQDSGPTSEVASILEREADSPFPQRRRDAVSARETIEGVWTADDRTRGNTYSTASTMIRAWTDPGIAEVGAIVPAIDLEWLLSGNNTLYVIAPEHDFKRLAVVYGALFGDLFTQAYEHATMTGDAIDPIVLFVLDEAAQTPVDWLPSVASTCAGIGILLVTIWQSIAQMQAAFGRQADTVLTNHGTKLFFSGISDPATLEYVRQVVGEEEVHTRSTSTDVHGGSARRSVSDSATRLPLIGADTLRRAPVGDALLIHGTLPPAHLRSRPWFAEQRLQTLAAADASR